MSRYGKGDGILSRASAYITSHPELPAAERNFESSVPQGEEPNSIQRKQEELIDVAAILNRTLERL